MASPEAAPRTTRLRVLITIAIFLLGVVVYLLAGKMSGFPRALLEGLGTLVAVGIAAGFVYDLLLKDFVRREALADVQNQLVGALTRALSESGVASSIERLSATEAGFVPQLERILRQVIQDEFASDVERIVQGAARYGFAGVVDQMAFDDLFKRLEVDDELLWLDTYCPRQAEFEQPLRSAVLRGAHVRMLAMDPKSPLVALRANEIDEVADVNYGPDDFCTNATAALTGMAKCITTLSKQTIRGSMSIRVYGDLPCVPMYLRMHQGQAVEGFTSFFLTSPTYKEAHLRWVPGPQAKLESFVAYFNRKWESNAGGQVAAC